MKIRISALDRRFSRYIRSRDKWTCRRCGARHAKNSMGLHCAHIFSRSRGATRFDEVNCVSWCYGCHSFMDRNPLQKYEWVKQEIGEDAFEALRQRAESIQKIDRTAVSEWLKIGGF